MYTNGYNSIPVMAGLKKQRKKIKNSAKRDTRPLKGMFNSPIYVHMGGEAKKKIFGGR